MNTKLISPKQIEILKFPYYEEYDAIICDGAVRSGKTIWGIISFVIWAMSNFREHNFAICGKTIASAVRNVVKPVMKIKYMRDNFVMHYNKQESLLVIKRGHKVNYFYIFGGKDESSFQLIQGITLAGIFYDEVALMPRSFVEQGMARCSVEGSKFYFNCNPSKPSHWFYEEWIKQAKDKKAYYLHFTMDDNPSLSEQIKARYRSLYTGVFYKRYIEGKWVSAEGVIYELFNNQTDDYLIDELPANETIMSWVTGIDFGGSKSSTAFVTLAISRKYKMFYLVESEKLDSSILNTKMLEEAFSNYMKKLYNKYRCFSDVYCDSAEPLHIRDLQLTQQKEKLSCSVRTARKEEINYRIQAFNTLFSSKRIKILRHNKDLIQSFKDAVWDDKHSTQDKDVRLDDGSYCVDLLDASEYALERYITAIYQTSYNYKEYEGGQA